MTGGTRDTEGRGETRAETERTGDDPFEGSPIDRRTFLGAAAATGASLALPGTVAADEGVGTLAAGDAEINVLGSILPPAQQSVLHPFGMADYSVSFMGHTLLCNALGFEQRRYYEGELIRTYGEVR